MGWLEEQSFKIGWTHDHGAAYLVCHYEEHINVTARWIRNRPELTTFDPARWRLGQAHAGQGGTFYDAEPVSGYF